MIVFRLVWKGRDSVLSLLWPFISQTKLCRIWRQSLLSCQITTKQDERFEIKILSKPFLSSSSLISSIVFISLNIHSMDTKQDNFSLPCPFCHRIHLNDFSSLIEGDLFEILARHFIHQTTFSSLDESILFFLSNIIYHYHQQLNKPEHQLGKDSHLDERNIHPHHCKSSCFSPILRFSFIGLRRVFGIYVWMVKANRTKKTDQVFSRVAQCFFSYSMIFKHMLMA